MKRAVVTGAAGTLGRAFCKTLAANGYLVIATDRDSAVMELQSDSIRPLTCDLTEADSLADLTELAREDLDVLVNCAGTYRASPIGEALKDSLASMHEVLDNNLRALVMPSRALTLALISNGGGHIVNVTSRDVLPAEGKPTNDADNDAWLASQWAVNGATDAWATRLAGSNIRVNALCVGGVVSPLNDALPSYGFEREDIDPAEVAELLLELVASDLTGENIGFWPGRTGSLRPARARHRQITG